MENFLPQFLTHLKQKGLSEKTLEFYEQYVTNFFKHTRIELQDLSRMSLFIKKYDILWQLPFKNSTRRKYINSFKVFVQFCIDRELIKLEKNILENIKSPRVSQSLPKAMEFSEIETIFDTFPTLWNGEILERNLMIFNTFLYTGLRRQELINLEISHFLDNKILVQSGKWDKDRYIYLPHHFSTELRQFIQKTKTQKYIFTTLWGDQITISSLRRIFEKISKNTHIYIHPHKLRHEYASRMIEQGIDIATVRDQMGHSNISTTNRYIWVRDEHRARAIQILNFSQK